MGLLGDAISGVIGYQVGKRRAAGKPAHTQQPVTEQDAVAALEAAIAQGEQVMRDDGVELSEAEAILREGGYTARDLRDPAKQQAIAALFARHGIQVEM